ncbi:CLPC1 [Symbiodinium pilosum]|uniref:CLPC1 protein n=1 Tax=Symbiodinium pilosum TaxID=2952 RepID=A0A812MHG4_SYMPI|nr:CLPC1 [Symbiodinium pilosum]
MKDDSLGSIKLDTRSVNPGQWQHYRLQLEEGQGGELEFDVFLKPAARSWLVLKQPCG